jgi:tRNA(Arg) A34 adenosine deaminase TadA
MNVKQDSFIVRIISRRDFLLAGSAIAAGMYLGVGEVNAKSIQSKALTQGVTDKDREFMRIAIQKMRQAGVVDKTGGPFGAVIALNGEVVAATGNSVIRDHDPSAHAEVNAIREACRKLGRVELSGATLYSSCELCPMCYATAYWARVDKVFYAASWSDYDDLFDDKKESQDMAKHYPQRKLAPRQILHDEAKKVWEEFRKLPDGARY